MKYKAMTKADWEREYHKLDRMVKHDLISLSTLWWCLQTFFFYIPRSVWEERKFKRPMRHRISDLKESILETADFFFQNNSADGSPRRLITFGREIADQNRKPIN